MVKQRFNIAVAIFFLISGYLIFADLQDQYLWNDEAFASVMARNTLKFGYPRSFDGVNFLYPDFPEFNWPGTHICIVDPWFPIYLTALSFKLFGISTLSSRLPFVVAGFLALIILFIFCIRYLKSKSIAFISVILTGTNVPFLLLVRQARYYGLVILLCLAIFYLYHRIISEGKGYFLLGFTSTLLALTHHAVFVPVFCGLWLVASLIDRKGIDWTRFIAMSIAPLVFFSALALFSWVGMSDASAFPVNKSLIGIKKNFEFQIRTINGYFVPAAFWIAAIIFFRIFNKPLIFKVSEIDSKIFKRMAIILICNIAFFSVFGMRTVRYYIQYLPFLCIFEAFLLYSIFKWKKFLALLILSLIIFTNLLAKANPMKLRTYFFDYLYEITHEYTGPLEAVCRCLDMHARPGERIKIVKGDLTVMFYHPELVILNDARYFKKSYPEWIVIRKYWNPIFEGIWRKRLGGDIEDGYLDVMDRYEKIALPAVDSIRENEPDNLETHFFRTPNITTENQMSLYHLK